MILGITWTAPPTSRTTSRRSLLRKYATERPSPLTAMGAAMYSTLLPLASRGQTSASDSGMTFPLCMLSRQDPQGVLPYSLSGHPFTEAYLIMSCAPARACVCVRACACACAWAAVAGAPTAPSVPRASAAIARRAGTRAAGRIIVFMSFPSLPMD
ncbi:hypothetical protein IMZ11_34985 [Microtetraspora sp. AC03309]|nr:hypothetical protein [Microtetraspora sp. AC03309]